MISIGLGPNQATPADPKGPPSAPANLVAPSISGTPAVGEVISVAPGTWNGLPVPTIACQWQRNGLTIVGATGQTYLIDPADDNANLGCLVTAANQAGSATAESNTVLVTYPAPVATGTLPDVSLVLGTGDQIIDASVGFTRVAGGTWSVSGAGASISAAGLVSIPTGAALASTLVNVTYANSGGSVSIGFDVEVVAAAAAPDQFASSDWTVADKTTGGAIAVTINAVPFDGGSPIGSIQYRVATNAWTTSGLIAPGSFDISGLTDGVQVDVRLRAVNSIGNGSASAVKSVTPTLAIGLPDQDAVWGDAGLSIAAFGGTSGTYAATGLPIGVTINAATGEITGPAVVARAREAVSVTRGGVEIHNFKLGVTFLSGTAAPAQNYPNLHVASATVYDSGTESTAANLANAIKARADSNPDPLVGTGNTILRKILWTGGDILKNGILSTYTSDLTPQPWADRVYVIIDGQGAQVGQINFRHRNVQLIWVNWRITGLTSGSNRNPFYNFAGGSRNFLYNCKVGPYFHPDTTNWASFQANDTPLLRIIGNTGFYGAAYCHFAGFLRGSVWDLANGGIYDVENMFTHFGEDVIRSFNAGAGNSLYIHRRGSVLTRMLADNASKHCDVFQIGAQTSGGSTVILDDEACLSDMGTARYPGTYIRAQKENGWDASFTLGVKDCVVRINGYDAIVNGDTDFNVSGFIAAPPPGLPMTGGRITLNYGARAVPPGVAIVRDATIQQLNLEGEWIGCGLTMTGASSTYDVSSQTGIEAKFPGVIGGMITYERFQGLTNVLRYTAAMQPLALHPAAIRAAYSTQAVVNGGWVTAGVKDPAVVPVSPVWGSAPSGGAPAMTFSSVSNSQIALALPGPGIVYYMLDMRNDQPTPPYLMSGVEAKGSFSGSSDQGDLGSTVSEWGRTRFTSGGAQIIALTGPRGTGTHTCYAMFEDAVTGMLSPIKKASFSL